MRYLKLIFILLLSSYGCANMVTPTGGKKDEKIPELLKSNLKKTNFRENVIRLQFNENITLENASSTVTIQPKHTTFNITTIGKVIKITFDSSLKKNTTYILQIDKSIRDVHEGNTYSLSYIFSTGEQLDTNFIQYRIENLNNNNIKIGLTTQSVDTLSKLKFDYLYNISQEKILIQGLNHMPYKAWIFTDKNNDNVPDEYSPVYYDSIHLNQSKSITLNNWVDSRNLKVIKYKFFTKIFKQINDVKTYNEDHIIYIDQDSALFYHYNGDSLPALNYTVELNNKLNNRIQGIHTNKDYVVVIDKCGIKNLKIIDKISYLEDENYFYINSRTKIDSINFKISILNDSISFYSSIKQYNESNTLGTLKINKNIKYDQIIMVIYKDKKRLSVKKISLKTDHVFYMDPGAYTLEFYNTNLFKNLSFDFNNLTRANDSFIKKEITLKPNWDEVLQLIFP